MNTSRRPGIALLSMVVIALWIPRSRADEPINWRTDYNSARREAEEKGLPLFIEVGTEACFYCKKLDLGPLRDPAVVKAIDQNFVPLRIDANREVTLARALKVSLYPTMVLAGHDGKIHAFLEGYMETAKIQSNLDSVIEATSAVYARELQDANQAAAVADYPRAMELYKATIAGAGEKPLAKRAREAALPVERRAAAKLARARALEQTGTFEELTDALAEIASTYRGTRAGDDAAEMLAGLGDMPEKRDREFAEARVRRGQELLSLAKGEYKAMKYSQCLQHCEELAAQFPESVEAREAATLTLEIQTDPERLAIAEAQLRERTASMQFAMAESWVRKGHTQEATTCLERVVQLCPGTRLGEEAKSRLASLGTSKDAYPTGFRKPN